MRIVVDLKIIGCISAKEKALPINHNRKGSIHYLKAAFPNLWKVQRSLILYLAISFRSVF